jgi:methyl coenzyme M reductase beta subunit
MKRLFANTNVLTIIAFVVTVLLCAGTAKAQDANDPNLSNLFSLNRILTLNIYMDPAEWDLLRNACPDVSGHCDEVNPPPDYEALLSCGTQGPMLVGIHRKSDIAEPSQADPQKVSLKIDINLYVPGQTFAGKQKLDLECGSGGAVVSEGLSWIIEHRTGMVSPQSAWVKVYVNDQYKGIYSNVEQIDKIFLSDNSVDNDGWLYKMEDSGEQQRTHENPFLPNPFQFKWYPFDHPAGTETIPPPADWMTQSQWRVNIPHLLTLAAGENFIFNADALVMKGTNYWYYDWSTNPNDINDPAFQQPRLYFAWDQDTTMKSTDYNKPILNNSWQGHLQKGLINELQESGTPYLYHTFQANYLNTYKNLINGPLEINGLIAMVNAIEPVISSAMNSDPYQSTGSASAEFSRIRTYLTNRNTFVKVRLDEMAPLPGTFVLNDSFEGTTWDANWNDIAHTWTKGTDLYYNGGLASAKKVSSTSGTFTSDNLNTSDANAVYVRFWYNLDDTEGTDLRLYFYNGTSYVEQITTPAIADGVEDTWLCYYAKVTDSQFFKTNFRIQFSAVLGNGENVWVDAVEITKTLPVVQYTITTTSGANGYVDPNGAVVKNQGSSQLFTAHPNTGYTVDTWYLDSSPVQTGGTTYNLTNIQANHTLNVTFKLSGVTQYTITTTSGANGYVDPNGAVVKNQGESQLFTAHPNTGYTVDTWYLDSSPVQTGGTTYNLTNIQANHTLNVTFKQLQYTITASSGANGYVDPNGAVVKNYGSSQLFTAHPNTGYEVDQWYLDSSPIQTGGTTYNLTNIQAAHTVNVTFKQLQYTITTSSGSNGYVDPNGAVVKNYGSSQLFTAHPNTGYTVDTWYLDSSPIQTGGTTYNLTNIQAAHTVNVTFKLLQYTVNASSGANGYVDPNGAVVKNYGSSQLFTAHPNTGYEVDQWYLDSSPVQTGGTTYNLTNIQAAHTVNVTFKQLQYTVNASSGANGYVDPNGAVVKNYGENQLFTAHSSTGYEVDQWYLDSSPAQTGGTTYNLTNIQAAHTVNVTFKQLQYTVTAGSGANGYVDPNGAVVKNYGQDQLFTATANTGYMVDTWYLDGSNVQLGGTTYTLTNIQSAHTVNVTFTTLPADNFDDNTQSALWQTYQDSGNNTWLRDFDEANQRLQLQAVSQVTSYKAYLLGHYKMNDNEPNTRVLDSSGNGKHGTAARNTSILHTTGQIGGALTFNGTTDSVSTGIVMSGAYTKVAWIKRVDATGEYNSIISADTSAHTLWVPRYRGFKLSAGHNTNRTIVEDPAAITAGVWYFVAVTFDPLLDSGKMVLYKNGAPVSTATSVPTPVSSTNTSIGKWGGGYLFNGAIDNVMLFNRALTADEIATLYNGGAGTETLPDDIYHESETMATSTVGHWKLNDNDANTRVLDGSGNSNNGTAQQNTSVLYTTGKIDGALAFNGASDYINLGNVVGTGAYTKVAWVKRDAGNYYNSILSSDGTSHVLWAPYDQAFKLSAGHNGSGYQVQDTAALDANLWYYVAVTYDPAVHSGLMVLYKNGVQVDSTTSVAAQAASTATYIGRFGAGSYFKGAVDNVMVFDRALTAQEIAILYNGGAGTESIPSDHFYAAYLANGWQFDVSEDFQVKVGFHYSALSSNDGWMGITLEKAGDPDNYVSLSAGTNTNQPYFFYEKLVDGSPVTAQQARASADGTLYVSYDASLDQLYVSSTGYGSANAWQTVSGLLQGQWASESLALYIGGGTERSLILPGQAYLDNFVIDQAALLNWPILADLNGDGFIDLLDLKEIADNWLLSTGPDLNDDGIVDFFDFTIFNQGW